MTSVSYVWEKLIFYGHYLPITKAHSIFLYVNFMSWLHGIFTSNKTRCHFNVWVPEHQKSSIEKGKMGKSESEFLEVYSTIELRKSLHCERRLEKFFKAVKQNN